MTQKDYVLIAKHLDKQRRYIRQRFEETSQEMVNAAAVVFYITVCGICHALQEDSERFDTYKFMQAVGFEEFN